jgi:hypothetical protein
MVNGEHATGKVIGRKRTADGELVGKYHPNRNLDTRQYEVEYQNGTREAHLMNSIAVALHLELDDDGKRWYTFYSIVDHKPGEGGKGRTKGWLLEIMWKDGTATWETLTAMKEMNMPRCAEYAERLGLADEPAFSYWVKFALKKRNRLLKKVLRRKRSNRFKYGIALPRTVKEVYALDTANGTNSCNSNSNLFRPIPTYGVAPTSSRTEPSTTNTSSCTWMIYYASLWILLGALFNP